MSNVEGLRLRARASELFELHAERLNKAIAILDPSLTEQDREDLVQETFFRTFRRLASFRGDSSMYTFMYRVAVNLHIDEVRKTARHPRPVSLQLLDEPRHRSMAEGATSWEGALVNQLVAQDEARELLQALNDEERRLLALCWVAELPRKQVGELMGITPAAVSLGLHRLKQRIRMLRQQSAHHRGL